MDNGNHDDHLLPGQRFVPMEDELLLCYLKPLVHGMPVPGRGSVVFDCDLYGRKEPWVIWDEYKDFRENDLRKNKDLFFFTIQKKKTLNDSRVDRTVGRGGTWKEESGKKITTTELGVIGYKKTFCYKNQFGSPHEGCWIMHEFELDSSQLVHRKQVTNHVLCVLRKKREPKKRRQQEELPEDDPVPDDGTNLIINDLQPKHQRFDCEASTSSAPSQSSAFEEVKGELWEQYLQQPPGISDPYAQAMPLQYDFPGGENQELQQFSAGDEQYWEQQYVLPSGDEENRSFPEMDENQWQHMVAQPGARSHPHTSRGPPVDDGAHHKY